MDVVSGGLGGSVVSVVEVSTMVSVVEVMAAVVVVLAAVLDFWPPTNTRPPATTSTRITSAATPMSRPFDLPDDGAAPTGDPGVPPGPAGAAGS